MKHKVDASLSNSIAAGEMGGKKKINKNQQATQRKSQVPGYFLTKIYNHHLNELYLHKLQ